MCFLAVLAARARESDERAPNAPVRSSLILRAASDNMARALAFAPTIEPIFRSEPPRDFALSSSCIPSPIRKSIQPTIVGYWWDCSLSLTSTTPPPPPGQLTRLPFFALHRGFGFVTFRDSTVVSKVLADESWHVLDNKRVSEKERRKKPRDGLVAPPPFHPPFCCPHKQTTLRAILFVLAVDRSESGRRSRNEQRF